MPTIVPTQSIRTEHNNSEKKLLKMLGEELKQPLVSIAQLAEVLQNQAIGEQARRALRTIDSVLLYERIVAGQTQLRLEPVHVGSIITDVAQSMQPLLLSNGCRMSLAITSSLPPVEADKQVLQSALISLLQGFSDNMPAQAEIVCRANRTKHGVRVSFVSEQADFSSLTLQSHDISVQPLASLQGQATDVLTAKHMMGLLGSELTKTTTKLARGFGLTLRPSRQLQII